MFLMGDSLHFEFGAQALLLISQFLGRTMSYPEGKKKRGKKGSSLINLNTSCFELGWRTSHFLLPSNNRPGYSAQVLVHLLCLWAWLSLVSVSLWYHLNHLVWLYPQLLLDTIGL